MKPYALSLHIFRRDLRLIDNTALMAALESSEQVLPCFIFDEHQIELNNYFSKKAFAFMLQSLAELDEALLAKKGKLYFFAGIAEKVVATLISLMPIKAIFINRDYTPFSKARDAAIKNICDTHHIDLHVYADALLHEPEEVLKANQKPYTIFTPFFRRASVLQVSSPQKSRSQGQYYLKNCSLMMPNALDVMAQHADDTSPFKGGRRQALVLLKKLTQLKNYHENRNYPALSATTYLSPHHKFGTISIRETFHAVWQEWGQMHSLITELYWRDFFTHIAFHFPHVMHGSFHQQYDHLSWKNNDKYLVAWQTGQTGFPIVDAGMRELNETGFMHNRVRMIVASFLTKDLLLNWQLGERYFAHHLVDYDPAVNNGNWQWAASTGCDAQPYFRIFNPWLQQKKFDLDCEYIKKWIPQLTSLSPKDIHDPMILSKFYIKPIVNHAEQSKKAIEMYRDVNQSKDV